MRSLIRLLEFTQPYWRRSLITLLSLLSITALSLIVPALIKQVIDFGLGGDHPEFMPVAGLILIGIGLVRSGFNFVQRYNAEWLSQRMAYDIRNALNDRLQRLSFGYHDHAQTGQLLSRCTEDVTSVQRFVGYALLDLINIVLLMTGIVFIMFRTDAHLALLALIPIPFLGWFTVRFRLSVQPLFTRVQQALSGMSTVMQESLTGVQVVKAFAREPHEFKRFELRNQQLYDSRLRIIRNWGNVMPLMSFIIACSTAILLLFGGRQVIDGTLTLGDLAAFNSYVLMLAMPVQRLGWLVNIMSEAAASSVRIYEVLDTRPDIQDAADAIELPALGGRVEFDCVSFKYAGTRPALSDVSFVAEPDTVVALIGPTGSGKSTIINLIPRFYDVSRGRVCVDGIDVRSVQLESLRRQIGIVLQESVLFSISIRDNIKYGRPEATDDEVMAAAKAARAHDFILSLPDGYATVVGEKGVTLSGGQRQRVAIARALLMDPRILILDDSTSSVDVQTEHAIQLALAELMKGRTTFVIAQRLATVKRADQILVLDQGRIVQRGAHAQLLAEGGLYREIYDLQLRDQEELRQELAWAA